MLLLWSLFVLATALTALTGTPFALASSAVITTRAFGIERPVADINALFTPRAIFLWGPAAFISIANAILVRRWHRERR